MTISSYLDTTPVLGARVFVHPSAQVIGSVALGEDSSVWCNAVLRGDVHDIRIGRCTNIQDLTMGHVSHRSPVKPEGAPLLIGDHVTIGHSVILHACTIGNRCLVGMGTIVMDDVVVADDIMIGAGSLVPPGKVLDSRMLYLGNPVKAIRPLTEAEVQYLVYSAEHYVRVKDNYLAGAPGPG